MAATEYFTRAIEAVKENKQHYAAAEARTLTQPKSRMAGFLRTFVTSSKAFKSGGDDE